jgi:hypothetical protein
MIDNGPICVTLRRGRVMGQHHIGGIDIKEVFKLQHFSIGLPLQSPSNHYLTTQNQALSFHIIRIGDVPVIMVTKNAYIDQRSSPTGPK